MMNIVSREVGHECTGLCIIGKLKFVTFSDKIIIQMYKSNTNSNIFLISVIFLTHIYQQKRNRNNKIFVVTKKSILLYLCRCKRKSNKVFV